MNNLVLTRWRIPLLFMGVGLCILPLVWLVTNNLDKPLKIKILMIVIALLLNIAVFFRLDGTITFRRGLFLYLILLGFSPILRNIGGLATLRLDELFFPFLLTFTLLPLLLGKMQLLTIPKSFIQNYGAYLVFLICAIFGQTLTMGQINLIAFLHLFRVLYLMAVTYIFFVCLRWEEDLLQRVIHIFLFISLMISFIGILQYYDIGPTRAIILEYYPRITTFVPRTATSVFGGNPNILGTFLLIPISFVSARLLVLKEIFLMKFYNWFLIFVLSFCLFLTAAKLAIFTWLALMIAFLVLLGFRGKIRSLLVFLVIFFTIICLIVIFAPYVFYRINVSLEGSTHVRLGIWAELGKQILTSLPTFLFGYGFQSEIGTIADSQYIYDFYYKGIFGIIGYLVFMIGNLLHFFMLYMRTTKDSFEKALYLGMCGMLFSMLLIGITYTTVQTERVSEWLFGWLAIAYASERKQNLIIN